MKELIEKLEKLIALVEDIDSTLFHHNHTIDDYHLNGDTEPIMNFVAEFDMEALTEAKNAIYSLAEPVEASEEIESELIDFYVNGAEEVLDVVYGAKLDVNLLPHLMSKAEDYIRSNKVLQSYATQSNLSLSTIINIIDLYEEKKALAIKENGYADPVDLARKVHNELFKENDTKLKQVDSNLSLSSAEVMREHAIGLLEAIESARNNYQVLSGQYVVSINVLDVIIEEYKNNLT